MMGLLNREVIGNWLDNGGDLFVRGWIDELKENSIKLY